MATAEYNPHRPEPIRPEIETVLGRLRSRIRRYVFLEGTAWVIVALGAVFWLTLAVNWAYFKVSNLELPVWFRMLIDVAAIAFLAGCLMLWLIQRLLKSMRSKALALVLERRFPELDDRLITAVEAAELHEGNETPFTQTLRNRTIAEVSEATRRLEVGDVFSKRPLRNAVLMATVFIASIVGFGMLNRQAMGYWYKAFFGLQEEYWDRETLLVPHVVSPADERSKRFRDIDGEFVYKHPRGEDFTLAVAVPTEEKSDGQPWVVPQEVEWDYELENDRGGATVNMSKTGDRIFRQTVPNLIDGMTFSIRGNDYVNRKPFRVVIVDPPNIKQLVLDCDYPDYTGLDPEFLPPEGETPSNVKVVDGSQVSEPMETNIIMNATTNKPLTGVRVEAKNFRLTVEAAYENDAGETVPAVGKFELLAQDGVAMMELPLQEGFADFVLNHGDESFKLPVKLATDAPLRLTPPGLPLGGDWNRGTLLNPFLQVAETADWLNTPLTHLPLSSNTVLRIYLQDTDDVLSTEPSQLTIDGIVDQPPELDVECVGIGEFITPKARIPVAGTISDDYGVIEARFDYQVTTKTGQPLTGPEWVSAEFANPPADQLAKLNRERMRDGDDRLGGLKEFQLEQFDTTELDVGQTIEDQPYAVPFGLDPTGEYILRCRMSGESPSGESVWVAVLANGRDLDPDDFASDAAEEIQGLRGEIPPTARILEAFQVGSRRTVEIKLPALDGREEVLLALYNPSPGQEPGNVTLESLELDGPIEPEMFDVTEILFQGEDGPRGVRPGDVLQLTVFTRDGDDINGPHRVRQKPKPEYTFKVVSENELMAILYQKELGLLSRFQQIITEVEGVRDDLEKARDESAELKALRENNPNVRDEAVFKSLTATSQRSIQQAAKNRDETRVVEESFREIVRELGNNGIVSRSFVQSLNADIIKPLKKIRNNDFGRVLKSLEEFQTVHGANQDADPAIGRSLSDVNAMLVKMKKVLQEMDDLLGYQELKRNLAEIIEGTEGAKRKAAQEQLEQLNKLKLLD